MVEKKKSLSSAIFELHILRYQKNKLKVMKSKNKNKMNDLRTILHIETINNAIIFCNKKSDVNKLNNYLKANNFKDFCKLLTETIRIVDLLTG